MVPKGYSNSAIGLTTAASNILIMLFQPVVAAAIDKYRKITLHSVIIVFTALAIIFSIAMLLLPGSGLLLAVIITLSLAFINILQPFVNAISVDLENRGYRMNFGLCRAFGSFGYAIVSTLMGFLISSFSEQIIPITSILVCMLFIYTTLLVRAPQPTAEVTSPACTPSDATQSDVPQEEAAPEATSLLAFMFSNKRFLLFLLSTACLFTAHSFTTGYLYQISCDVGGDSSSMGIAGSIAAMLELPGMMLFAWLLTKASCRTLLRVSGFGFFLRFLSFFLADSVPALYAAQIPQAISYAIFIPASVHYVSRLFSKADMAKAQSLVTTACTIGGILASVVGGRLLDAVGVHVSELCVVILGVIGALLLFFSVQDVSGPRA